MSRDALSALMYTHVRRRLRWGNVPYSRWDWTETKSRAPTFAAGSVPANQHRRRYPSASANHNMSDSESVASSSASLRGSDALANGFGDISAQELDQVKQLLQDIRLGVSGVRENVASWKER